MPTIFELSEENSIVSRLEQTFAVIALLGSIVILSPVYVLFGKKWADRLERPAIYSAILVLAVFFVLTVSLLSRFRC